MFIPFGVLIMLYGGESNKVTTCFLNATCLERGWELLFKAFDLKICLPEEMDSWFSEALIGWDFKGKAKVL